MALVTTDSRYASGSEFKRRSLRGGACRDYLAGLGVPFLDHERVGNSQLHGLYELLLLDLQRPLQLVERGLRPLFGVLYGLQPLPRPAGSHVDPPQIIETLVSDLLLFS